MQPRRHLQHGFVGPAGTAVRRLAASRGQPVAAPAAGGPGAGAETRREKAGPGGHSAPPAIPYSFPYTCRHRNPRGPENAQAVPGINLRVDSQTYLRAQLVKQ